MSRVTLKFDRWPWKTIGHLFYIAPSFVHHFIAISWLKLELLSGNFQSGSKSTFSCRMTLQFDGWPTKATGHLFYATSSFMHHFVAIGELKLELLARNAQIRSVSMFFFGCVTLKFNGWPWKMNMAPLLSNIKLWASFHHHMWIQTGATV